MVSPSRIRIARDYNRTLVAPVRWAHLLAALVAATLGGALRWVTDPVRRTYAVPGVLVIVAVAVIPLDPAISGWFERHRPAGDLRRELEALQQFGQLAISLVIAAAIFLLDRRRARRLLDWAAAAVIALITVHMLKGMTGRPRPGLADPWHLTGPAGMYPVPSGTGFKMDSPWTSGYDLASLPSRHACFAALAAVFLSTMYPRLRPLALTLTVVVMAARVILGAHYPSDVLVGAALGAMIAEASCRRWWGVRAVDWAWKRAVDPYATPALHRLVDAEASTQAGGPGRG